MAINAEQLKILHYPAPALRRVAEPVPAVTPEVRGVVARMLELMHQAPGIGLAAPQVGLSWRVFVANPENQSGGDTVFINPVLSGPSAVQAEVEEGCLSLPDVTATIRRPAEITIDAVGLDGEPFRMADGGMAARVWQHEYDHLDAVLIIDRMGPIDRMANRRAIRALSEAAEDGVRRG